MVCCDGAVGSLPTLTRPYLGTKHAVCTWPGLRVWPGAREGCPLWHPWLQRPPGAVPGLGPKVMGMSDAWSWSAEQIPSCG